MGRNKNKKRKINEKNSNGHIVMAAISSQAAVITVTGSHLSGIFTDSSTYTNALTVTQMAGTPSGDGSIGTNLSTYAYTLSGLTLDGVGSGDDSVTVTLGVQAWANTHTTAVDADIWARGNRGYIGVNAKRLADVGDRLRISFDSLDVTLGGGEDDADWDANSTFDGYTGIRLGGMASNATTGTLNGVQFSAPTGSGTNLSFAATQSLQMDLIAGQFRPDTTTFSVSVIPEPATIGLIAVFGGGVMFIRRRMHM